MFQHAPSNLEFYFADIDFEDLHGLQDTAREVKIRVLLEVWSEHGFLDVS